MFILCTYWRRWSRILSTNHQQGHFVEVNLTPIRSWEEDVSHIRIRLHGTARDPSDKLVTELPPEVKSNMINHLGEELTSRLLTEDFLSQIDWERFKVKNNGGAKLEDINIR
jgi:hypothetical protein